jgi:nucleoside-diphosphate-sugar epimerase
MKVVVTGGAGFIGTLLARRLLQRGELTAASGRVEPIESLVLLDITHPDPPVPADDPRVRRVTGNVTDVELLRDVVDGADVSLFHLAAMVSSACEADFDGALRANLDGTRAVFEALRARRDAPRAVFASSVAAFGGDAVTGTVSDSTKLTPQTTYGMTKAIGELLVDDYTRRGFIDGRSGRLPTVIIRPGRPNAAASSWVSGLFREPLGGQEAVLPVDLDTRHPVTGYRTLVDNLVRLHEVSGADIGPDRSVNLPALSVTAREMIDALRAAAPGRALGPIVHRPDPAIQRIFSGWARRSSFDRAAGLGLRADTGLEPIIQGYLDDFLTGDGATGRR